MHSLSFVWKIENNKEKLQKLVDIDIDVDIAVFIQKRIKCIKHLNPY